MSIHQSYLLIFYNFLFHSRSSNDRCRFDYDTGSINDYDTTSYDGVTTSEAVNITKPTRNLLDQSSLRGSLPKVRYYTWGYTGQLRPIRTLKGPAETVRIPRSPDWPGLTVQYMEVLKS